MVAGDLVGSGSSRLFQCLYCIGDVQWGEGWGLVWVYWCSSECSFNLSVLGVSWGVTDLGVVFHL